MTDPAGGWSENHEDCELRLTVLRWKREDGVIILDTSLPENIFYRKNNEQKANTVAESQVKYLQAQVEE